MYAIRSYYDTIFLEGEYKSLTSTQNFSGTISNDELAAVLSGNEISGRRTLEYAPLRDYYSIAKSAIDSSETYLFNPEILKTKEWRVITSYSIHYTKLYEV